MSAQSTDDINSAALVKAKSIDDDVSTVSQKSSQLIAQDRSNQNRVGGSGGDNPGANVQAGK